MNQPNFNPVARAYRWMEYLSFGPLLERCRFAQLERLGKPHHALVLGDGDGRFLERLLTCYPLITVDVIDASSAMVQLAKRRTQPHASRVCFHVADVRTFALEDGAEYDLVTAHFLLDCLTDSEVNQLLRRITPHLAPNALCVVSEFAIPARGLLRSVARLLIGFLYAAFRILTGLQVRRVPDYGAALRAAGFTCEAVTLSLGGILRSERWRLRA